MHLSYSIKYFILQVSICLLYQKNRLQLFLIVAVQTYSEVHRKQLYRSLNDQ